MGIDITEPSADVFAKAAEAIKRDRAHIVKDCVCVDVRSNTDPRESYRVSVERRPGKWVVTCPCTAGQHGTMCHHGLVAVHLVKGQRP